VPLVVELHEERFGVVAAIPGEVAPPVAAGMHGPRQAAAEVAEVLERRQPHRFRIEDLDLAVLGNARIIRVGTDQLALPQEPAVKVLGLAGADGDSFARRAVVLRHPAVGDCIDEPLVGRRCLVGLRGGKRARFPPLDGGSCGPRFGFGGPLLDLRRLPVRVASEARVGQEQCDRG
jgi:hypothetical protein